MSYNLEAYKNKKSIYKVVSAGVDVTLDNLIMRINPVNTGNRMQLKAVASDFIIWGVELRLQQTSGDVPSAYGMAVLTTGYTDVIPATSYGVSGVTDKLYIRCTNYARPFQTGHYDMYVITVTAGVGSYGNGFDKYAITIERV